MANTDTNRVDYSAQRLPIPNTNVAGTAAAIVRLSVAGSAVSFGASAFSESTEVVVAQVRGGSVYVSFDGTPPSATNGISLAANETNDWSLETARAAKFIQNSGTASVNAAQFRYGK